MSGDKYEKARVRMISQQLIPRGIDDPGVLRAMEQIPRHLFVDEALQAQAYGDTPLPIGRGQTISQPYIVALMTQALQLQGHEKVLEVGTGSGYQAAILSRLCERVYTIERIDSLLVRARKNFDALRCHNILSRLDDGTAGWSEYAPFNAIMVTAGGPKVPDPLLEQLADPGVLVIPVGDRYVQELLLVTKRNDNISSRVIENVRFVNLLGTHGWNDEG